MTRRGEEEKKLAEEETAPIKTAKTLQLLSTRPFTLLTHSPRPKRVQQLRLPKPPPEMTFPSTLQLDIPIDIRIQGESQGHHSIYTSIYTLVEIPKQDRVQNQLVVESQGLATLPLIQEPYAQVPP